MRELKQTAVSCINVMALLVASVPVTESTHTLSVFYNQLQYEKVGIPVGWYEILCLIIQTCGLCNGMLEKILHRIPERKLILLQVVIATTVSFSLISVTSPVLSVVIFAILTCIENMYFAILNVLENETIGEQTRASTLSFYSLFPISSPSLPESDSKLRQTVRLRMHAFSQLSFLLRHLSCYENGYPDTEHRRYNNEDESK